MSDLKIDEQTRARVQRTYDSMQLCMHSFYTWIVNSPESSEGTIFVRRSVSIESKSDFVIASTIAAAAAVSIHFVQSFIRSNELLLPFNGKSIWRKRVSPSCINGVCFLWLYGDNDDDEKYETKNYLKRKKITMYTQRAHAREQNDKNNGIHNGLIFFLVIDRVDCVVVGARWLSQKQQRTKSRNTQTFTTSRYLTEKSLGAYLRANIWFEINGVRERESEKKN